MNRSTATNKWALWSVATTFVFFQLILQMSPGTMIDAWMRDFHTNRNGVSYLSASLYYSYLPLQIPVGLMFDRYGPRHVLTVAAFILGIGCVWLALSPTYVNAFLARIVMGTGCTFAFIGMLCIVSESFSNRAFGFAVGLSETVAMLMTALGTTAFAYAVAHTGWRDAMLTSGALAFIIMVIVFLFVHTPPIHHPLLSERRYRLREQISRVIKHKDILLAGVFGFASFGIINVFGALWGEPFFNHVYDFSLRKAAFLVTIFLIGVASGGPSLAWLSTHLGRRKPILAGSLFIEVILFLLLLFVSSISILWLCLLTYAIGFFSASYIVCFAFAKEHGEKALHGTCMAVVNFITMLSAPILQSLVGWLLHNHIFGFASSLAMSFRISLSVLFICFFVGLLAVAGMKETHCHALRH